MKTKIDHIKAYANVDMAGLPTMMTVYVCHACSGMKPMPGPRPGHPCTVLDIINFARAFIHDHRDCAIVQARKAGHYTDVFDPEGADG